MTATLFKERHYILGNMIGYIGVRQIGLPNIRRFLVWANPKVRDLFDAMHRGYKELAGVAL